MDHANHYTVNYWEVKGERWRRSWSLCCDWNRHLKILFQFRFLITLLRSYHSLTVLSLHLSFIELPWISNLIYLTIGRTWYWIQTNIFLFEEEKNKKIVKTLFLFINYQKVKCCCCQTIWATETWPFGMLDWASFNGAHTVGVKSQKTSKNAVFNWLCQK